MPRPRRSTSEAFYDVFADMPIPDQAAALKILEQVHRLAVRDTRRAPAARAPDPQPALDELLGRNAALDLDEGPKQ